MAYLHSLIVVGLLLLSSWLPTSAYADCAAVRASLNASGQAQIATWTTAQNQCIADNPNNPGAKVCGNGNPSAVLVETGTTPNLAIALRLRRYWWPDGTLNTDSTSSALSCVEGPPPGNACTLLTGKSAGNFSGAGGVGAKALCDTTVSSGDPALPHCLINGTSNVAFGDPPNQTFQATMFYTGAKCIGGAENPNSSPPTGCPIGQVNGMVNGEPYCYKPSTDIPKTTTGGGTTTTTNPDGSTTQTTSTQTTSCTAAGSCSTTTSVTTIGTTAGGTTGTPVTTSTTSTCQRGTAGCQTTATNPAPVTTSTTTTGSTTTGTPVTSGGSTTTQTGSTNTSTTTNVGGGSTGGNGSGTGNGGGGEGGMFAGTCGSIPICDGDAVMCAVAAATFTTNCTLTDPKLLTPLYDSAITKTGDQTATLPGNSTVSVAPSQFDQTELLGGASGMSDRTVTVAGHSISLPFSSVNIWLQRLGLVLQAVTFLVCARIVIRG